MKKLINTTTEQPKTLIVGVQSPDNPLRNIESYYEEFKNLVRSSGREIDHSMFIKLRSIEPGTYFTKGKLEEIKAACDKYGIEEVVISEPLSVTQERNLETELSADIVDRTLLILEIFERGAISAEGKKQVALARFQYDKGRLVGRGIQLSQQSGRIGTRGPGETAKEKETQHLERMMHSLKKELEHLGKVRSTQRKRRVGGQTPLLCLIGYTNAGKSTILNSLTKSEVLAENKLFSTLDTTTRELYFESKKYALISDTVGFIQQLPHHLVEAFKSTLSELEFADLLLHVVDVSDPNWEDHITVVLHVLDELEVDRPMLYVFNKIDKVDKPEALEAKLNKYQPYVIVSAIEPDGLKPLIDYLKNFKTK